jgi:hypothetical protein
VQDQTLPPHSAAAAVVALALRVALALGQRVAVAVTAPHHHSLEHLSPTRAAAGLALSPWALLVAGALAVAVTLGL